MNLTCSLRLLSYCIITGILFLYLPNVQAFRTDHGFLPPGISACAAHVPVTLTVPNNAKPIPDSTKGEYSHGFYHVGEIEDGLFYVTDGVYQAMIVLSDEGIILVDAPPSIGVNQASPEKSLSFLQVIFSIPEAQGKPIKKLIYSHSHFDHIGAASIIKAAFPKIEIIAQRSTRSQLEKSKGKMEGLLPGSGTNPPPFPNSVFSEKKKIQLGKQVLELHYKGPVHEPGNIFIYAPKQKVLMLVDVIFPGWSPFNGLALAEEVPEYVEAYNKVLNFDFNVFIGGHFNRLGSREDVLESQRYIDDIKKNALTALKDPSLFTIFGVVNNNLLAAAHIYLDQMACKCANLTLDSSTTPSGTDWRSRIGNADINTLTHCWSMGESLRIDPPF